MCEWNSLTAIGLPSQKGAQKEKDKNHCLYTRNNIVQAPKCSENVSYQLERGQRVITQLCSPPAFPWSLLLILHLDLGSENH